ncbi:uncharacterized protein LOC131183801 [Hevea brasiliensis]|uniref:uncharacterized protein LOC131183801 n=1 Tax=Hevea brasiliensis TaxID=3981 RepID=UPI0025E92A03|nr:uncharacterized protein LOC131183801 [Hevea brasiliensis]
MICGGGLVRDFCGRWLRGFAASFGKTSVLVAELWSIHEGLKLVRSSGFTHVLKASFASILPVGVHELDIDPSGIIPWIVHRLCSWLCERKHERMKNRWRKNLGRVGGYFVPKFPHICLGLRCRLLTFDSDAFC